MREIKQHATCPLSWAMLILASAIAYAGFRQPITTEPTSIGVVEGLDVMQVPFNQEVGQ